MIFEGDAHAVLGRRGGMAGERGDGAAADRCGVARRLAEIAWPDDDLRAVERRRPGGELPAARHQRLEPLPVMQRRIVEGVDAQDRAAGVGVRPAQGEAETQTDTTPGQIAGGETSRPPAGAGRTTSR